VWQLLLYICIAPFALPTFKPLSLRVPSPVAVSLSGRLSRNRDDQRACCCLQASNTNSMQLVFLRPEFEFWIQQVAAHTNQDDSRETASPTTYRFWRRIYHRCQYFSSPTSCFVLSHTRRRLQANTSRSIKLSSAWYWWPPSQDRRALRMWISRNCWREVLLLTQSKSLGGNVTVETNSFNKTESLAQRCVCVGCQLNSDQTLGLLCLKGHERDSTLRRHQLTRSEWILVY